MNMKKAVTWFLLVFVATTVVLQIVKTVRPVKETVFNNGKHLVFFHAEVRCPTCTTMERLVKQVLQENFQREMEQGVFDLHLMDYESRENRPLVEHYKIATSTVLLFEQKDGKYADGRSLTEFCWKLVGDEPAFRQMLKTQINDFLQGKEPVSESKSEEIMLDPNLNLFDDENAPSSERKQ